VFRPDDDIGDVPRRSSRSEGLSARKTPAALVVIPAIALALLVFGGTLVGVIIKERPTKVESQESQPTGALPGPTLPKSPVVANAGAPKGNQAAGLEVGNIAPDIVGEDIDGQQFKLSDYRGKVVVIDFWGHW
jgi:hypothetical protein